MGSSVEEVWREIRTEAAAMVDEEPTLASYYYAAVLKHQTLVQAISFELANKLNSSTVPAMLLRELIQSTMEAKPAIYEAMVRDICAHRERDPACDKYSTPLLHFKGFHALQAHRISHELWLQGRQFLAFYLQNRISQQFSVDIHPGARVGSGIMLDHATGLVVGETAVLGNDISILHSVTLGGIGCEAGDRHPKVQDGVLISVGAKILGNITIGEGARIGAGSVVLSDVPPYTTVAGVPGQIVGRGSQNHSALSMDHFWEKMNCD
ncbi:serine O-acetyltransferase [Gilvimarinus sp. F26214L]|uniref:serine O-acetyltransferase n=1 Tax=Gilvimarinus sp. DZF01 TaxID=3461371 RepID=UPI00404640CC